MTEIMSAATEKKVQLQLQLQASDALKVLMSELVKPELRRDFARRAIYLALYNNPPIQVDATDNFSDYTHSIEDVKSKTHMYNRSLHLAPEIGIYEHQEAAHGVNIRFKLALAAIEAKTLFAPPFDAVNPDEAYVMANLPRKVLDDDESRPFIAGYMRRKFSTVPSASGMQARAPDLYYVSRPTVKKRVTAPSNDQ